MSESEKKNLLQFFEKWLSRIIGYVIGILLSLMVIIVFSNVISRYFLNSALAWSEELSRIMLIWLVFLGSVLAYLKNEHLGLDILINIVPVKISRMIMLFSNILVVIGIAIILYGGYSVTAFTFSTGWTSPALAIPYGIVYMVVPFSALLLLILSFIKLKENISGLLFVIKGGK